MRTEEKVREMYRQYVYRCAIQSLHGRHVHANQYFGAAVACGRTLEKDMKRISQDLNRAKAFVKRRRDEGKPLPGFKDA